MQRAVSLQTDFLHLKKEAVKDKIFIVFSGL